MPPTKWAKSGELHIAYQVVGSGPIDVVCVTGFASNIELAWESDDFRAFLERLSRSCRLIMFDKRGTGLSDRTTGVPTLEERMDDMRAVMDAVGVEQAALYGISEGGPMSILFAATYPERVRALLLEGSFARFCAAPDHPVAPSRAEWEEKARLIEEHWGSGFVLGSIDGDTDEADLQRHARFERNSATPGAAAQLVRMNLDIDVRGVLDAVHVPTLVTHTSGDSVIPVEQGRYLARHIPGAQYIEIEGGSHNAGRSALVDDIEEFLTGARRAPNPERILATVLFTDIVGSTERAVSLGDEAWKQLLARHHDVVRQALGRWRGREVNTAGDGFLATFDGPGRAAGCALELIEGLRLLGIDIRAGVHTGEIECVGNNVAGIAVHIGARVASLAAAGEVWATRTVRDLTVGSSLAFESKGDHQLKGVPDLWQLYRVTSPVAP